MRNTRMFTLMLFAFTYYVICSCKFFSHNNYPLNAPSALLRRPSAASNRQQRTNYNTDRLRYAAPQKRKAIYDAFPDLPNMDAVQSELERTPYSDFNRIVGALKEMLRTREGKTVSLRPRPGRRSMDADFPLWHYLIDDAGNMGIDMDDTVAIVEGVGDVGLSDGSLKKSIPFRPRLGKRGESQISE